MRSWKNVGAGLVLTLLVVACSDDGSDESTSDTSSAGNVATPQLTFDGTACTYAGPAEVTEGAVVVEFVNASDDRANIGVEQADEGYTVDDVVAYLEDPANIAGGSPSWLSEMNRVPRAEPGETITWEGDLDAGEYVLHCQRSVAGSPWAAGAVTVGSGLTVVAG